MSGPRLSVSQSAGGTQRQRGFSIIEAMVTLVIVSVGALGLAGLQTVSVRSNNAALLESVAATYAQDLIERMKANATGDYEIAYTTALDASVALCDGTGANCDANALADYDLFRWKCGLGAVAMSAACASLTIPGQLPNGNGEVDVTGSQVEIRIRWRDAMTSGPRQMIVESEL